MAERHHHDECEAIVDQDAGELVVPERRPEGSPHIKSRSARTEAGRPNRSYRIGTTTIFSAVELSSPNIITIAIGACKRLRTTGLRDVPVGPAYFLTTYQLF